LFPKKEKSFVSHFLLPLTSHRISGCGEISFNSALDELKASSHSWTLIQIMMMIAQNKSPADGPGYTDRDRFKALLVPTPSTQTCLARNIKKLMNFYDDDSKHLHY
jgi:hypothetical protein